jgi:hypothetical protein
MVLGEGTQRNAPYEMVKAVVPALLVYHPVPDTYQSDRLTITAGGI